jgi:PAS domain S-box-containing protein
VADAFPGYSVEVHDTGAAARATLDEGVACVCSGLPLDEDGIAFLRAIREYSDEIAVVGVLDEGVVQVPADALTMDVSWCRRAEHDDPIAAVVRSIPLTPTDDEQSPLGGDADRYRELIEHIADPVYLLDPAGYIEMVNEALIEKGNYDREEIVGAHVTRVMPEESITRGAEVIVELLENPEKTSETVELEIIHDDGTHREYEDHISVITDDDGSLVGTVGIVRDIQERKERERELEQYETIVETVPQGVFVLDEYANILAANEQGASILGVDLGRQESTSIPDLVAEGKIDDEVFGVYEDAVTELLSSAHDAEQSRFRYTAYPTDGEERTVEVRIALRPFDEEFRGTVGVMEDVTEREQRIEELERYETIMQAVPDAVFATDQDGFVTFLNDAAYERYGYEAADIESRSLHFGDVVAAEDVESFEEANRRLLSGEYDTDGKAVVRYTAVTKDGRRFPAESHHALMDVGGDGVAGAGITRDISALKQREQRLQVLDRVLRHNLRNDLNAVYGNAELLERRLRDEFDDQTGIEVARSIQRESQRLVEMSRDIRQIQQALERDRMDRPAVDAVALVERVLAPFRTSADHVTIDTDLPDAARIEADETLELALANLVENAIEHHDREAPEIEVRITARNSDRGDWYELSVADDGPGIPEQERVALQTDVEVGPLQHGTGIGLWAVAWIVGSFDGTVEIADREPRGTVVSLVLRRAD